MASSATLTGREVLPSGENAQPDVHLDAQLCARAPA
jgi:hypothetical protein